MFLTEDALERFRRGNGWTAGVDATIAWLKVGANGRLDTTSIRSDVAAFVLANYGVMAGASLQGTRISKLD
jgi:lipid-binding SYLF domain-containing protein